MGSDDITTDIEPVPEDSGDTKPIDKVSKELAGIRKEGILTQRTDFLPLSKIDTPLV